MDELEQLQAEMVACRLCQAAGYDITPPAIFRGDARARVMLIGQAPGVTEVEARRPFNAGSGRRLFQWLGEAGWAEKAFRTHHYMTAVTKCYPGKGRNGKGDRVPSKAEQALCRPFLKREISLIKPQVMILVGGLAIKLLYPSSAKLGDVIGTAVYFPAETLANPVNFDIEMGQKVAPANLQPLISQYHGADGHGRFVVPLPHPSGASLWPNKPANQALIGQAIHILRTLRIALSL